MSNAALKANEFFARHLWSLYRPLVKGMLANRCTRCTISENVPSVTLVDGVCNFCRDNTKRTLRPRHSRAEQIFALNTFLRDYTGSGQRQHDAVVMLSGGKDSTFLLFKLHLEHPQLRILAVTIDNGFSGDIALNNAKRVTKQLDVDHLVITPHAELYKTMYRYAITHLNAGGCYTTVDRMDGWLNHDICRNIAAIRSIPLVISGASWAQVAIIVGIDSFEEPSAQFRTTKEISGIVLKDIFSADDMQYWWDGTQWPALMCPRTIYPHFAWHIDDVVIQDVLRLYGLITETSPLITNNEIVPLMVAIDFAKLGYCGFAPEFARMIRNGQSDKKLWRNVFEMMEYKVKTKSYGSIITKPLKKLDLSLSDVGL